MKRKPSKMKTHPGRATRLTKDGPEPKREIPGVSAGTQCYRCSRCGLVEDREAFQVEVLQDASQLPADKTWQTCPAEGPLDCALRNPDHPGERRVRFYFDYGEISGRACTLMGRNVPSRGVAGFNGASYGFACHPRQIEYEWFIQEFIKRNGVIDALNLANLLPAHGIPLGQSQGMFHDRKGRWFLSPRIWLTIGDWLSDIALLDVQLPRFDLKDFHRVVTTLYEAADPLPGESEHSKKATLYVPIDLRFSISEQLEIQLPYVKEVQSHLLSLSGREGVYKIDREVVTNRLLCYVLREYGGLSSTEIARRIFPNEHVRNAASKVRTEITRVRRLLLRAAKSASETPPPS